MHLKLVDTIFPRCIYILWPSTIVFAKAGVITYIMTIHDRLCESIKIISSHLQSWFSTLQYIRTITGASTIRNVFLTSRTIEKFVLIYNTNGLTPGRFHIPSIAASSRSHSSLRHHWQPIENRPNLGGNMCTYCNCFCLGPHVHQNPSSQEVSRMGWLWVSSFPRLRYLGTDLI